MTYKLSEDDEFNKKLQTTSNKIKILAHPERINILAFIDERESVIEHEIYNNLEFEPAMIWQHLSFLITTNLVKVNRAAKFVTYRVNYTEVEKVAITIKNFPENIEEGN